MGINQEMEDRLSDIIEFADMHVRTPVPPEDQFAVVLMLVEEVAELRRTLASVVGALEG